MGGGSCGTNAILIILWSISSLRLRQRYMQEAGSVYNNLYRRAMPRTFYEVVLYLLRLLLRSASVHGCACVSVVR